ncbi:STAS domain-containing protein [Planomonospora corallina]|uniref:STAS domain-containing protein n=1 Tax=Planomonospora corallina TaxID=1806052 RepID=A0ABV8IF70_9ACTN
MTVQRDDAAGVLEADGAAFHGVVSAVLYADRRLRLTYRPQPGAALIRLIGEIDATNRAALEETLVRARHGGDRLLVDVRHLRFVDVGGLRTLAELCRTGTARLVNVPPRLHRLAGRLGLSLRAGAPDGASEHD